MKSKTAQKIKLTSYDELLGGNSITDSGIEIEISKIYPFINSEIILLLEFLKIATITPIGIENINVKTNI